MVKNFYSHVLNLNRDDLKHFKYLCYELETDVSKRIRHLMKQDLIINKNLILRGIENQKIAIENISKDK